MKLYLEPAGTRPYPGVPQTQPSLEEFVPVYPPCSRLHRDSAAGPRSAQPTPTSQTKTKSTCAKYTWLVRCRRCSPASVPAARRWRVARCPCGWAEPQRHPAPVKDDTRPASLDPLLLSELRFRERLFSEQNVHLYWHENRVQVVWWCPTGFTPQCVKVVYLSSFLLFLIFLR